MKILIIIPLYLIILITNAYANHFENVYKLGDFKIFYTLYGRDKLPVHNQVDINHNNVPDYIEYIGEQLEKSARLFDTLDYICPLESKRYKDKAYFITVSIVDIKYRGITYDGINKAKKNNLEKAQPSLAMKISNNLSHTSLTPLHEYFHLIQNGYTMFKTRWYTEGTARWSESLLKNGIGKNVPLPQSQEALDTLLSQTYKTSSMWNRLAYLIDTSNCQPLAKKEYDICGTQFMKRFLEHLMVYDKLRAKNMGYHPYHWKEVDQKSPQNNRYILMALADTLNTYKSNHKEIQSFLKLVAKYIHNKS